MRGRYVNDFGRRLLRRPRDHDPFLVNRSRNHGRPGETKNSASLIKSRIFDPRDFTTIYQGHRADHHRLLRSGGDDDLVRMTARTSVIAQVGCDRLAQLGVATARGILEQMRSLFRQDFRSEPFPNFYREIRRAPRGRGQTRRRALRRSRDQTVFRRADPEYFLLDRKDGRAVLFAVPFLVWAGSRKFRAKTLPRMCRIQSWRGDNLPREAFQRRLLP